ncbi:phosphoglycerate mutase-like protein [Lophium mytilinum]|uniref:3-phytase n=1 Tax=Lophium mytilinum TaxID=390894 RepID=A0A6A6QK42_9PEZI|nr:phosphoglycerate mutase-like protein [Lophium mytilinum]
MTTLVPREPYTEEELTRLYPKHLKLQLVQVLLRHGERTPVSARFQNAGLAPNWPYCNAAKQLKASILATPDLTKWDGLTYRRRIETFGDDDGPIVATGPSGEFDSICKPGELTDVGRQTTLALGQRLRHLYVDQLAFMPKLISDSDMIYLRATPIPRALESLQQAFWGFYPPSARTADFPTPTILTRAPQDETLYPNDGNCRRYAHLSRAFAQRAADHWNDSDDMAYLNKILAKWMPDKKVAVDSHPRLSGLMDTINATLAHGPATRLPKEFYDSKARAIIDKIGVEEWYAGYLESAEYRMLGVGALAGDIVTRMTGSVEQNGTDGLIAVGGEDGRLGTGRGGEKNIKLALSGCHDTTLAGLLSALGAFEGEKWPPFTSHIAFELFTGGTLDCPSGAASPTPPSSQGWLSSLFGLSNSINGPAPKSDAIARKPIDELSEEQKKTLRGHYVRIRYNDKIMQVPGCKAEGKHLEGDTSFCTLEAFKSIVDKFTPKNWKHACSSNLDSPTFPARPEPAGY